MQRSKRLTKRQRKEDTAAYRMEREIMECMAREENVAAAMKAAARSRAKAHMVAEIANSGGISFEWLRKLGLLL